MQGLTKRQSEVLSFIQEYIRTNRFSPSYRDIMDHFGFASLGSVAKHIEILKRKKMLVTEKNCKRSLYPTSTVESHHSKLELEIPYIGTISSGTPIETFPQSQRLAIPEFLVRDATCTYALRARGNSLTDELISDGDILLVEARNDAYDGETVVAVSTDQGTLVKRYHPEGTYVRLLSQSSQTTPLILRTEDLRIQGVILSLLRLYT